jgi:hypothetical protein
VTHSGITLAPIIGRFVACEIVTGQRDALLEPYGLARFSQAIVPAKRPRLASCRKS